MYAPVEYLSNMYGPGFHSITFQYVPTKNDAPASLSFHLTAAEKKDISQALYNEVNEREFNRLARLLK
jgi:hypothetical protein